MKDDQLLKILDSLDVIDKVQRKSILTSHEGKVDIVQAITDIRAIVREELSKNANQS